MILGKNGNDLNVSFQALTFHWHEIPDCLMLAHRGSPPGWEVVSRVIGAISRYRLDPCLGRQLIQQIQQHFCITDIEGDLGFMQQRLMKLVYLSLHDK